MNGEQIAERLSVARNLDRMAREYIVMHDTHHVRTSDNGQLAFCPVDATLWSMQEDESHIEEVPGLS